MNLEERQRELLDYLACKKSDKCNFQLRKSEVEAKGTENIVLICFCGSGSCASLPRIVQEGRNGNIGMLFFDQSSDVNRQPIINVNLSRSQLFAPAKGQNMHGKFTGICQVCNKRYSDYRQHVNLKTHSRKIATNAYNKLIIETCEDFKQNNGMVIKGVPIRKKDKYANKFGKTRKLKYDSRNKKTGKFEKKCQK